MKIITVTGQTGTGKTARALDYAKRLNGELVSADSRQIYRYLDIVTGKDKQQLSDSGIPYHLVDRITPDQSFSSHTYAQLATPCIVDIIRRNKTPIIVGGTYLYIRHLLYGQDIHVKPNDALRDRLSTLTIPELQRMLRSLDHTIMMNDSDWNNPRRLIRHIEVRTAASAHPQHTRDDCAVPGLSLQFQVECIGLRHHNPVRARSRIGLRVKQRLEAGALEETRALLNKGYKKTDPGLKTIGYTQLIAHLEGELSLAQAIENWITAEVQYAKRQLTFMKRDPSIQWVAVD